MELFSLIAFVLFVVWFVQMCMITGRLGRSIRYQMAMLTELRKLTGTPELASIPSLNRQLDKYDREII